jgi:hypothetical protein
MDLVGRVFLRRISYVVDLQFAFLSSYVDELVVLAPKCRLDFSLFVDIPNLAAH